MTIPEQCWPRCPRRPHWSRRAGIGWRRRCSPGCRRRGPRRSLECPRISWGSCRRSRRWRAWSVRRAILKWTRGQWPYRSASHKGRITQPWCHNYGHFRNLLPRNFWHFRNFRHKTSKNPVFLGFLAFGLQTTYRVPGIKFDLGNQLIDLNNYICSNVYLIILFLKKWACLQKEAVWLL